MNPAEIFRLLKLLQSLAPLLKALEPLLPVITAATTVIGKVGVDFVVGAINKMDDSALKFRMMESKLVDMQKNLDELRKEHGALLLLLQSLSRKTEKT